MHPLVSSAQSEEDWAEVGGEGTGPLRSKGMWGE